MSFLAWLTRANSVRNIGLSLYQRGLSSALKNDYKNARDAFNAVIDMRDVPAGLRAMALYQRALLFGAANKTSNAIQDLKAVLAMIDAPHRVKSAARQKLEREQRRD
jgi:hypothetical protein